MKCPILVLFVLINTLSFAQINFDNSYSSIGGNLHPKLLVEGDNSTYYGLGNDALIQIDQNGNLLFAKSIDCKHPVDFSTNSSHDLIYGQVKTDINGNYYSILSKRNELGDLQWERRLGSGFDELRIGAVYANDDQTIIIGGALKSDSVWHNFLSKYSSSGAELWTRKFEQYYYLNQVKVHNDIQIVKITQSPDLSYYSLSHFDNKTLIYKFQGDGAFNGSYKYSYRDSLIPIDIVAVSADDIQVLCSSFSTYSHSPEKSIIKFRIDSYMTNYDAREYKKQDVYLSATDLECKNNRCYILGNGSGMMNFTLIERTTLEGYHNQTREVHDQNWNQIGSSMISRNDESVVFSYRLEPDSTSIISATNSDLRSACDFYLGALLNTDISLSQEIATGLTFSAGDPLTQAEFTTTNDLTNLASVNHCFGAIGISEESTQISIFPNPTTNFLNIDSKNLDEFEVTVLNLEGKVLLMETNSKYLDLSHFANGIYNIRITSGSKIFTQRLVIQN